MSWCLLEGPVERVKKTRAGLEIGEATPRHVVAVVLNQLMEVEKDTGLAAQENRTFHYPRQTYLPFISISLFNNLVLGGSYPACQYAPARLLPWHSVRPPASTNSRQMGRSADRPISYC